MQLYSTQNEVIGTIDLLFVSLTIQSIGRDLSVGEVGHVLRLASQLRWSQLHHTEFVEAITEAHDLVCLLRVDRDPIEMGNSETWQLPAIKPRVSRETVALPNGLLRGHANTPEESAATSTSCRLMTSFQTWMY